MEKLLSHLWRVAQVASRRANKAKFEKEEGFWNLNASPAKKKKKESHRQFIQICWISPHPRASY